MLNYNSFKEKIMNKRPIVYVARDLTFYNERNAECKIASYVSEAYLKFKGQYYEEDGSSSVEYIVDYVRPLEHIAQSEASTEFYADSTVGAVKGIVFDSFAACKDYVEAENTKFAQIVGSTSASKIQGRQDLIKQALAYGEELEKLYIPYKDHEEMILTENHTQDNDDTPVM